MLDNANDVQTSRNERSNSCFADLDRLLVDPKYGAAELARLHEQSKHALDWAAPFNYRRTRPIIVDWLVKAFDTMGLRDEWLVNCICLLDRISSQRAAQENGLKQKEKSISLQKDWKKMLVESLCAVLMALKISSAEAETRMPVKHIIFNLMRNSADSGEELWPHIFQTELRFLLLIDFRVAQPTAMDLVGRLALDVALAAPDANAAGGIWPGLAEVNVTAYTRAKRDGRVPVAELRPRFMVFSRFLVELALLHGEEDAYRLATRAPLVLALAAVHVALDSFTGGPPESCRRVVFSAKQLLVESEVEQLAECVPFLRELWSMGSPGDAVAQKWRKRQNTGDQVLPQPPADTEDQVLPQPSADVHAPPVPSSARTPPRRPTRRAMQLLSSSKSSKKLRSAANAANAATATETEPDCRIPLPLLSLGDASATDVVSNKTSAPTVTVVPTTPPTRSSLPAGEEPRSCASSAACRGYTQALEARTVIYKDALRIADHLAALKGRRRLPPQMMEPDSFDKLGPADKMHAVDHIDATNCRIAHQVDTQWPASHMRPLKRCRTHEHVDGQSLLKMKKKVLSKCGRPPVRTQGTPELAHI